MAMNLRLPPETETALRQEATRTGQTQQAIVREALQQRLGKTTCAQTTEAEVLVVSGQVYRPRQPYRKVEPTLTLPQGMTSLDLLDRDDRV